MLDGRERGALLGEYAATGATGGDLEEEAEVCEGAGDCDRMEEEDGGRRDARGGG